jgi:LPS O-antigen subunit length determinant protein (WzzB/FepE family)
MSANMIQDNEMNSRNLSSFATSNTQSSTKLSEQDVNIFSLLILLWQKKIWIILSVMIMAGGSALYAISLPNIYRSNVDIINASSNKEPSRLASLMGNIGSISPVLSNLSSSSGNSVGIALAKMKSKKFILSFIKKENMMPEMFPLAWDKQRKSWKDGIEPPDMWDAIKQFRSMMNVRKDKDSGLYRVSFEGTDPKQITKWENNFVKEINETLRKQAIKEANANIIFLKKELARTKMVEIQSMLYSLIEQEIKNIMVVNVKLDFTFKVIDPALVPKYKIKPKRTMMVFIGSFLGLMLSVLIILVVDFFRRDTMRKEQ